MFSYSHHIFLILTKLYFSIIILFGIDIKQKRDDVSGHKNEVALSAIKLKGGEFELQW